MEGGTIENYGELDAGCFLLNGDWVQWFPSVGETLPSKDFNIVLYLLLHNAATVTDCPSTTHHFKNTTSHGVSK